VQTPNAGSSPSSGPADTDPGARLVYVVSQDGLAATTDDEIDLFQLWTTLWRSRWLIAGITVAFALGSAVYASLLPPVYTANVVLAPVKDDPLSGLASQLGGFASLAGITARGTDSVEAVAVLRSRDFIRAFIEDQALLPVLFPDAWDATTGRWTVETPPDFPQAARFFVGNVRQIDEDTRTGLVTLSIEWRDPKLAAAWANLLATRLNDHMRQRALAEAEANVKYLRSEFESTSIVALQQSIGGLLENEMQKLMLARGNSEYAFRIIDRAEVPSAKSKPRVALIVVLATVFGGMLSVFVVFLRDSVKNRTRVGPPTVGVPSDRAY
jgi:uncharacterized protein involved in exopolysaccharide biosynthesis